MSIPQVTDAIQEVWQRSPSRAGEGVDAVKSFQAIKARVKEVVRVTNSSTNGDLKHVQDRLNVVDLALESRGLSVVEREEKSSLTWKMWQLLKAKECSILQKSRVKWLKEGDKNSAFFHSVVASRNRRNCMSKIIFDNQVFEDPELLKNVAASFFQKHYEQDWVGRPTMSQLEFNTISHSQCSLLESAFTESEVLETLNTCDGSRAPGPNGFNLNFFKKN